VLAGVDAVEVDNQFRGRVDHGGGVAVPGFSVDVAADSEPGGDPVKVAKCRLEASQHGKGGETGRVLGVLQGDFGRDQAGWAGRRPVRPKGAVQ
jgi:hypothetical protein